MGPVSSCVWEQLDCWLDLGAITDQLCASCVGAVGWCPQVIVTLCSLLLSPAGQATLAAPRDGDIILALFLMCI